MKHFILTLFYAVAIAAFTSYSWAQQEHVQSPAMSTEARAYLEEVFSYIKENAVFRERLNWERLRSETFAKAAGAETTADTYNAVRDLISKLEDNGHSSFFPAPPRSGPGSSDTAIAKVERKRGGAGLFAAHPSGFVYEVLAGSQAERAGIKIGDRVLTIRGRRPADIERNEFSLSFFGPIAEANEQLNAETSVEITFARDGKTTSKVIPFGTYSNIRAPSGRLLTVGIGYLEVPMFLAQTPDAMKAYAEKLQEIIRRIDTESPAPVTGWIVDLRRNQGGNMWPMLAGIGPLLGEGVISGDPLTPGADDITEYKNGQAISDGKPVTGVSAPYALRAKKISIAVLTGALTGSSGEFAALWFRGLPNARSFGEPTHGVPTVNTGHRFSDGSGMNLTIGLGSDRRGNKYSGPLVPDVVVAVDWTAFATERDPAVAAAVNWMESQKGVR